MREREREKNPPKKLYEKKKNYVCSFWQVCSMSAVSILSVQVWIQCNRKRLKLSQNKILPKIPPLSPV